MKVRFAVLTFLLAASVCLGNITFSGTRPGNYGTSRGCSVTVENSGFLRVNWDPAQRAFAEFSFQPNHQLGTFQTLTLKVKAELSEKSTFNVMTVRLLDRDGEIFQFTQPKPKKGNEIVFKIDTANFRHNGTWKYSGSAVVNKKLDFPVSLMGMSFHYNKNSAPGEIIIKEIETEKFPGKEPEPNVISFKAGENAGSYSASRGCGVTVEKEGFLRVNWDPAQRAFAEFSFQPNHQLGFFQTLTLKVKTELSEKSTFNVMTIRLLDRDGEIFQFTQPKPKKGSDVVFSIDTANFRHNGTWKQSGSTVVNKKLDFPVSLMGMSFHYSKNSAPGEIILKRIEFVKFPEKDPLPSFDSFKKKVEAGQTVYTDPAGINFSKVSGGQFRVSVKGDAGAFQKLALSMRCGKLPVDVESSRAENVKDGSFDVVFPVTYKMDSVPARITKAVVSASSPLSLQTVVYEQPAVSAVLDFGKGTPVSTWCDDSTGKLILTNKGKKQTVKGKVAFTICDDKGKQVHSFEEDCSIAPGGTHEITLPVPAAYGLYHLKGVLPGSEGQGVSYLRRYAYMKKNAPANHNGMQYGIALMTHIIPKVDKGALGAHLIGTDFIRSTILWMDIERRQGQWNWTYPDNYMATLKKHDLRWAPILWCPPRWATAKDWKPSYTPVAANFGFPRPDYELWGHYVRNSVKRYGDSIRVMEVWNEPELPGFANFTPEEYAELLKRAYQIIKQEKPDILVSTCGYTCLPGQHPRMTFPDFMPRSLKAAAGYYDIHSIHLHSFFPEYHSGIKDFLRLRKEWNVSVPWAANETAMTSSFCSREVQAEVLFEKMVFSQAYGSGAYVWHNMIDLGRDPQNKEHNFGLLDNAMEPKNAYIAFNTVVGLFRGAEFVKELTRDDCFMYLFRNDGKMLLGMWTPYAPAQERIVVLSGIRSKAFTVDIYGNRTEVPVLDGRVVLPVNGNPKTLLLEQDEEPVYEGELFCAGKVPGQFRIGMNRIVKGITASIDGGKVFPAAVKNNHFTVSVNAKQLRGICAVEFTFDTKYGKIKARRFLTPEGEFPAGSDFDRNPDYQMLDKSTFVSTSPHDPSFADVVWKGADDCSGKVWIGWKNGNLLVKTVVKDDIHFQKEYGKLMYVGDGLQILISRTATGGMWKFGVALGDDGKVYHHLWMFPGRRHYTVPTVMKKLKSTVVRNNSTGETVYLTEFPAKELGITKGKPFRFNLMINDNDGRCRVGYHSITEVRDDGRNDVGYPQITII